MLRTEPGSQTFASRIESGHNPQALEKYYQDEILAKSWSWYNGLSLDQQQEIDTGINTEWQKVRRQKSFSNPAVKREIRKIKKNIYEDMGQANKERSALEKLFIWITLHTMVEGAFALESFRQFINLERGTPTSYEELQEYNNLRRALIIDSAKDQIDSTRESVDSLQVKYESLKLRFADRDFKKLPLTENENQDYTVYTRLIPVFEVSGDY